jgi:hypothetical protein
VSEEEEEDAFVFSLEVTGATVSSTLSEIWSVKGSVGISSLSTVDEAELGGGGGSSREPKIHGDEFTLID